MTTSPLHTVPHLPVPIDTDQRNPLPNYHTSTSLKRDRVPLRTQSVALHPTGISPVPLKTIPTRPIEVQPISKVPLPGGTTRLPNFVPPKQRVSTPGCWGQIRIASQEPNTATPSEAAEAITEFLDQEVPADEQVVFAAGETREVASDHRGSLHEDIVRESALDSECGPSNNETRATEYAPDPVLIRERVSLPMQRVPMARMPRMAVGTAPIRTQTAAIRRRKNAPRPKKSTSARIW